MSETARIIIEIVLALIALVGAGGGITAILLTGAQKSKLRSESQKITAEAGAMAEKSDAETDRVKLDTLIRMIETMERRMEAAEAQYQEENERLRREICELRAEVESLRATVKELEHTNDSKEVELRKYDRRMRELIRASVSLVRQMEKHQITPDISLPAWIDQYEEGKE